MAKVTFSPLIAGMSGKTADAVMANWKGRSYVRKRVIPHNPQSAGQVLVRNSLSECVAIWHLMLASLKTAFGLGASDLNISGYNDWVGRNRTALQAESGLFGPRRNNDAIAPYIEVPTDFAYDSEPAAGQMRFTWTDPGQGVTYRYGLICYDASNNALLYQSTDAGPMAAEGHSIGGLTIADIYLVAFFVFRNTDDEMVHFGSAAHTQLS
jgi:hypothetical protein